jgi:large subunit ribosomal protein L4
MWQNQQLGGKKLLLVLPEPNHNVFLSSRNLPNVKTLVVNELNTYEIMKANDLLLFEGTVEAINQLWGHGEQSID